MATAGLPQPVVTNEQFRQDWPEFASTTLFPDPVVTFWLTLGTFFLSGSQTVGGQLWGSLLPLGVELFAAHNLYLEARAARIAVIGGVPGLTRGAVSSESPGGVSISYDTNAVVDKHAGHWNETNYGTRLKALFNVIGAGPIQIGTGGGFAEGTALGAWPGVLQRGNSGDPF